MEREETEEKESVRKTEKERHEMKYKVGDKVRVRRDLNEDMTCNEFIVTTPMADKAGDIVTISAVHRRCYHIVECGCAWTDEMFEPVEDELTAEEAFKTLGDMCARGCKACELGKLVKESGYLLCGDYGREHPDKVVEILKQWKKDHEKKEVKVQDKMYCRIVDGDGSTVYTEALPDESILNDRMTEILTKFCSEHDDNYFAVCERRWEVVK